MAIDTTTHDPDSGDDTPEAIAAALADAGGVPDDLEAGRYADEVAPAPPPERKPADVIDIARARAKVAGMVPPHDIEHEESVLSACLSHPHDVVPRVRAILRGPRDFFSEPYQHVAASIFELHAAGAPIDYLTVWRLMRDRGQTVGLTMNDLVRLVDACPAVPHVENHAQVVAEKAARRRELRAIGNLWAEGYTDPGDWRGKLVSVVRSFEHTERGPRRTRPTDILEAWAKHGPLVHEPTGIPALDEATDGGPVYGTRWYLAGAPDAGKTAMQVQIADHFLSHGVTVGLLAIDEEPEDIFMRFAQRRGFTRAECEQRRTDVLRLIGDHLAELPLVMYDASWTIERAAQDLADYAAEHTRRLNEERARTHPQLEPLVPRAMFGIDSIQTATCESEASATGPREQVNARVRAFRQATMTHRLIGIATSEMNRTAYRSVEDAEKAEDMATAKESGAIEYSARVLLALRSVAGEADMVELRIAKNKHGPRGERIHLKLDRRLQTLTESKPPEELHEEADREAYARERILSAATGVALCLARRPGLVSRDLRTNVRAQLNGCSNDRTDTAVAWLTDRHGAIVTTAGGRNSQLHYLVGDRVPDEVLSRLDAADRAKVSTTRPPSDLTVEAL